MWRERWRVQGGRSQMGREGERKTGRERKKKDVKGEGRERDERGW